MLSKKDIIALNAEFDKGVVVNESGLDLAADASQKSRNWLTAAALLIRAVLIGRVFVGGNKRTAAVIIMLYCELNGLLYDGQKAANVVVNILKKNITEIKTIERMVRDVAE
mgnify:CR=1 FL=1